MHLGWVGRRVVVLLLACMSGWGPEGKRNGGLIRACARDCGNKRMWYLLAGGRHGCAVRRLL